MKKPKKNKPKAPDIKRSTGESPAEGGGPTSASASTAPVAAETGRRSGGTRVLVRETSGEPVARRAAVPALLIALLAALVYFGDMYVIYNGGELDARVHHPFRLVRDLDDLAPKGEDDLLKAKGQKVYKQFCSACHQDDGNGNPSAYIPPLAGSDWVSPKDPGRMIRIVLNGLTGPITVNGKQWGQAAMLPWRDALTDEDIAAALTYVRSSWGNKAPAVKADEVKKLRDATKDRGSNWTADELIAIPLGN